MEVGNDYNDWKEKLIVTQSEKGCVYQGTNYPVKNVSSTGDISGAGDSFLAGLVFEYARTKSISDSIRFANKCASYVVSKRGVTNDISEMLK